MYNHGLISFDYLTLRFYSLHPMTTGTDVALWYDHKNLSSDKLLRRLSNLRHDFIIMNVARSHDNYSFLYDNLFVHSFANSVI